jgi:hypothetical protein
MDCCRERCYQRHLPETAYAFACCVRRPSSNPNFWVGVDLPLSFIGNSDGNCYGDVNVDGQTYAYAAD